MKVYTFSEARQNLASVLDRAWSRFWAQCGRAARAAECVRAGARPRRRHCRRCVRTAARGVTQAPASLARGTSFIDRSRGPGGKLPGHF
jgi:hypothetical protein